jgi:hypothetical protein
LGAVNRQILSLRANDAEARRPIASYGRGDWPNRGSEHLAANGVDGADEDSPDKGLDWRFR